MPPIMYIVVPKIPMPAPPPVPMFGGGPGQTLHEPKLLELAIAMLEGRVKTSGIASS